MEEAQIISHIDKGSPAERAGVLVGERLLAVNHHTPCDVLDVIFYADDAKLTLLIEQADKHLRIVEISKEEGEPLGVHFNDPLFDGMKTCENNCVFCFMKQNTPNMRSSTSCHDDDWRLSYLTGSYITLTNMNDDTAAKIAERRISPLHISVHCTDEAMRNKMLGNNNAGTALRHIQTFIDADIELHGQIVVCPGYNDGEMLSRTLRDMTAFASIAVVPVGLTKWREELAELQSVNKEIARDCIERIAAFSNAYAADELYLLAGIAVPNADKYDNFPQLENGVGLLANFRTEWAALRKPIKKVKPFTLVTGMAAEGFFRELLADVQCSDMTIVPIRNDFFGESVTVAGLVTGGDIIAQLRGGNHHRLLIPSVMLRHEGDMFLDNSTPQQVAKALGCAVQVVPVNAASLAEALKDEKAFRV